MKVEIIKGKDIPKKIFDLVNKQRRKEYGDEASVFSRPNDLDTLLFLVKNKGKIVAFGVLKEIKVNYLGKTYKIKGIGGIMAVEKGKGYGKVLVEAQVAYLKKTGKTGLGFCGRKLMPFYEKVGLKTKKDFIKRFVYRNPKTGKEVVDNAGDGLYLDGKDKFISKVLKTKSIVYIPILHW